MPLYFTIFDALLFHEFSFVLKASENNLITAQVDYWIWENVDDLGEYFLHQCVGFVQCYVQWAHVPTSESTSHTFVLGSQAPTSCMPRGIKFRHHSYPPHQCISNQISCLLRGICFFITKSSMLSNLRVRLKNQWESIFISDMPMEHTHLVIHHSIHSFIQQMNGQEVPGCVHHNAPIHKIRLIFDDEREMLQFAVFGFVPWALNCLEKSFQSMHESDVMISLQGSAILVDMGFIGFFLHSKGTFEGGILHLYLNGVHEPIQLELREIGGNYHIADMAGKSFQLLVFDQLLKMTIICFFLISFHMIQDPTWIFHHKRFLVVQVAVQIVRHREKVHL